MHIVDYPFRVHLPPLLTREDCKAARGTSKTGIRRLGFPSALAFLFLFLVPWSDPARATENNSPSEIVLGMSTVLSGSAGALGQDMQRGVLAGLERANRTGELKTLRLRLMALDDGYEPARAAINTRQLIETDGALAMIGNVGTPTAVVTVPLAKEEKTLLFAPFAGGPILRNTPPDRYVINFRASYDEETQATIDALIDVAGLKPQEIAFFTQKDNSAYAMGMTFLERHGLKDPATIIHVSYERNTLAVEGAVADLLTADSPPRAVMMYGAYAPCAKFIRMCRASNLNPLFLSVSFVGSSSLIEALGDTDARLIVTQVVPCPSEDGLPIVREYRADLRALDPSATAGYGDFEGYIATRILTLALGKIPGIPTREGIIDALEGLSDFDIGLGEPLHLSRTEHQASHRVWPTLLKGGHFVSFKWAEIGALEKAGSPR